MSERLKFFRKLMSAFEGTSHPQRAIERGFYVKLPNNPVREITRRIELRPSSVHLLFGGIGSGKTTQLLLTQQALNELEDIKAIYVDVSLVTDISDLQSGALIAIAGLELIKILGDISETELESFKQIIENLAYGYSENTSIPYAGKFPDNSGSYINLALIGQPRKVVTQHKGLLSIEKKENKALGIKAFSALSKAAKLKTNKEIVFLFDGLDRLSESKAFIESAFYDVLEIKNIGIGVVLVGSVITVYKERETIARFDSSSHYLSYIDTSTLENIEGNEFLMDVLRVRDSDNFITLKAKEYLIFESGGVLRDLMSLCQASIEEAYVDGADQITQDHVFKSISTMTRSKSIGLTDSSMNTFRRVMLEKSFFPRTSEDFELLMSGHILEYRYPKQRFVVHPILAPIIEMLVNKANG